MVRFKIDPNPQPRANHRAKRYATYIAHPLFPFLISVQYAAMQPTVINFHFRL